MKNLPWIMLTVALGLTCLMAGMDSVGAAEAKKSQSKLLHFGNMGGLLPSLKQKDLPEPDSEAADLVFKLCGQCHNPPGPGMHTTKEWESLFWRMYWRMHLANAQFAHFKVPTYGEGELMFAYLKKNAMQPISTGKLNMEQAGAKDFATYCNQCHQLPDPQMHKGDGWEKVVNRMAGHMKSMSKNVPAQDEMARILSFLKASAE